ncbi:MAG: hypothetical protein CME62_03570 [Halobacteriovoraceae bacterium]|nr:hypothetical protein [Halobacteriovoraceae bacterium]
MKVLLVLTFLFTLSCMPEQAQIRDVESSGQGSTTDPDEITDISFDSNFNFPIRWNNSGLNSETLTINVDNSKSVYILGDSVHDYLLNDTHFERVYCMEVRFEQSSSTSPKILRYKVIPSKTTNFLKGSTTKYFRAQLNNSIGNDLCYKSTEEIVNNVLTTLPAGDTNFDGVTNASDNGIVYHPSNACPECQNFLVSNKISFYYLDQGISSLTSDDVLRQVGTDLDISPLSFRIDMNSSSDNGSSSCSNNSCQAEGFDCCVSGQCVNEKSIKISGVQADPNGFLSAEEEKFIDTNWYKKYPQFYHICLEQVPTDNDGSDDSDEEDDTEAEAEERLADLILDYQCVEELITNSETDPFHSNPNTSASYSVCNSTPDLDYTSVMKRLYTNCGCSEKNDLDTMVEICPAYTYSPSFQTDSNGNTTDTIIAINCVTPEPDKTPLPFQDLEVFVNAKSAPHRFFDTKNKEIDPFESLPSGASGEQEGEEFQYLDDFFIFPKNGEFNMNSLLGQFKTDLSGAYPAKVVDVEFDKQYIISTLEGFLSSCPSCAKDSWFGNFSFAPAVSGGVGLRAVGFTTRRDTYVSNTTLGNYEDTAFGRACWLPPTMLPYTHTENADDQEQRLNRLEAQAALYINGYQKDWYGFNRGALIGSFDGVTWFAIGKGRIVKATSNKLYLAINAPFADLANATNHKVAVQEYDFGSTGAIYDYANGLEINDSAQNEAGSCQQYHECEVDADCITKLGWEYSCADVTYMQTKWPRFEALGASEIANSSKTGTIVDFLQQATLPPDSGTKRCVYRGAGAPCRVDYENISDAGLRKNLTCAPNFFCAELNTANFNTEVARYAKPLDELLESPNHFYGQEANILGRPKHYINTGNLSTLPEDVQNTLKENLLLTDASASGNLGICRPGKKLPSYTTAIDTNDWEPSKQHATADPEKRTDFISQIAGCNSALYTDLRYSSCPILDETGEYVHTQDEFIADNFEPADSGLSLTQKETILFYSGAQNACSLENLSSSVSLTTATSADSLKDFSGFKTIEAFPLNSSNAVIEPSLARDACLRKPGAVCHTDLDCSPNRMMANAADLVDGEFFGNEAEKAYYEEFLVCGQAESEPSEGHYNFNTYAIENNRCCRPIGETISMYTEDSPNADESQGLRTDVFGSYYPNEPSRYSRYAAANNSVDNSTKVANGIVRPSANTENTNGDKFLDNAVSITQNLQWETIHNTAAKTCCGGSWVRTFADGTNDWSRNRLRLSVENFKCLNYNTPLLLTDEPEDYGIRETQLDNDRVQYCSDPTLVNGGCAEKPSGAINSLSDGNIKPKIDTRSTKMILDTDPEIMANMWPVNQWAYYTLLAQNGEVDPLNAPMVMDWTDEDKIDANRRFIKTKLPSFVTPSDPSTDLADITISLEDPSSPGNYIACNEVIPANGSYACGDGNTNTFAGLCDDTPQASNTPFQGVACAGTCCFAYDPDTRNLGIAYNNIISDDANNYGEEENYYSARIEWYAPGTAAWESIAQNRLGGNVESEDLLPHRRSSTGGSALYYLERLSKLEYLGIPQMVYEPVYCNDNYQNLVPGIFEEVSFGQKLQTVADFLNHSKTFVDSNAASPWQNDTTLDSDINASSLNQSLVATQELISHPAIFSDHEFKCCLELGTPTLNPTMCCSGVGKESDAPLDEITRRAQTWYTCALPAGTDLNVYFNKFVSGEGLSDTYTETVLDNADFDARTGEPILTTDVVKKLTSLGEDFCASGQTRRGAAFGNFEAKPLGPLRDTFGVRDEAHYTIVDSIFDFGSINNQNVGFVFFDAGMRWNHHVYCDTE